VKQNAYFPQPHCEAWKQNNATPEMEITMNTRHNWVFGMAALGLALSAPVQAAPNYMDGAFIVAERDQGNEARQDQRDARKDKRREAKRKTDSEEPQGYGYGYERRQQKQIIEEEGRPRGRR
jgi:hypothetical protein